MIAWTKELPFEEDIQRQKERVKNRKPDEMLAGADHDILRSVSGTIELDLKTST